MNHHHAVSSDKGHLARGSKSGAPDRGAERASAGGIAIIGVFQEHAMVLAVFCALALSPLVRASDLELKVDLQNLFLFRSDSDFDRSAPRYDENGQTVGAFATLFRPRALWRITDNLRIVYEAELGLNFWSKQNPDVQDPQDPAVFVLKHREVFAEGEIGPTGIKAGYVRTQDPTGLFLNHWIGTAQSSWALGEEGRERLLLLVGQVPDQTFEGIDVRDNNFAHDTWVAAAQYERRWDGTALTGGLYYLYDASRVDHARWRVCPTLRLKIGEEAFWGSLDAMLQAGENQNDVLGGGWSRTVAWAAQGHLEWRSERWGVWLNALALSPDDAYAHNRTDHAFLSSAKSMSATLMLTEDEIRDWYDNVDERMSVFEGGFYRNRAGYFVADVKVDWVASDWLAPAAILGVATVLKPENALDGALVGIEGDIQLAFKWGENVELLASGGLLWPGAAGAAFLNGIDRDARSPIFMAELSLRLHD